MTGASTSRAFLPEVQALRALAVALVVVYHIWPGRLPGGFIGVDVFFVISGFLITAHLMREYESAGRISITQFWARRIRRLLPAAFVVLAACVVLAFTVLPAVVRVETLRQIAGASGYILNWMLGLDSVDYLAAGNQPTVVQHYWTLSVEEQFYIAWPLLLVAVIAIVARVRRGKPNQSVIGWAALGVVVASLAYSIFLTAYDPSFAYFATTTRAWEFAAGGLLAAVMVTRPAVIERLRESRAVTRWALPAIVGTIVIVGASFFLNGESPFPGYLAALPVIGTLFVIVGGMPAGPVGWLIRWRPVQFLGDVSYSVYLWHWPVLTTLVLVTGRPPTVLEGIGVAAASVVLAAATKYFVEDPGRRSPLLSRGRLAAFAFALIGILTFTAVWGTTSAVMAQQSAEAEAERDALVDDPASCFGANAMLGSAECPDRFVLDASVDLTAAANDLAYQDWCLTDSAQAWLSCEFGDVEADETWALVGDSHAASMVEAFDGYFAQHGVKIVTFLRNGCSGLGTGNAGVNGTTKEEQDEYACRVWSDRVRSELAASTEISTVVYLNRTSIYTSENRPAAWRLTVDEIVDTWQGVIDSGKRVISIKDWPITAGESIPVCLSSHVGEAAPCSLPRSQAMPADPQDDAIDVLGADVDAIDLTDAYCDTDTCYSVIGDVVLYADWNHLSGTYSRTVMSYLGPSLLQLGSTSD